MAKARKPSLADRLEAYFKARPGVWLDGHELIRIAGTFGLRSRISDVRARGLDIENRLRHETRDGVTYTVTEYKFTPAMPTKPGDLPFDFRAEGAAESGADRLSGQQRTCPPEAA